MRTLTRLAAGTARRSALRLLPLLLGIVVAVPAAAEDRTQSRGWVDSEPFLELAGDDDLEVEVSIQGALMKMIAAGFTEEDPELADAVAGLERIYAAVVNLRDSDKRTRGADLMNATSGRLRKAGWQSVVRVRDEESLLTVMTVGGEETVDGLVVLVLEKTEGQLVFVNLVGTIDVAQIEKIGSSMDLPGLEHMNQE